jgi:hypothetical protein
MSPERAMSHTPDAAIPHSPIPENWLSAPVDVHQVEQHLASEWMPESWLRQWSVLLRRMEPRDELWLYLGCACSPEGDSGEWQEGYAVVRDGVILDHIGRYPW